MKKKIFIVIFVTAFALFLGNSNVKALNVNDEMSSEELEYILENSDPNDVYLEDGKLVYSQQYLDSINEKHEMLDSAYQRYLDTKKYNISDVGNSLLLRSNVITPRGFSYTTRTLSVPTFQQETNYWCGPAAVKEILDFLNGTSLSQSTYASSMGTTSSSGTVVYKLRNELNNRQSTHTYQYEDISTEQRFTEILLADVMSSDVGVPFVLHAITTSLYMYNGTTLYHYLVVNGGHMANQTVTYVDSWSRDYGRGTTLGMHTDSRSNVANTVTASGRYVIY